VTMEAAGMAPEREEAAESKVAASVGSTVAVTRAEAASGQSPEGTRTTWVWASMGGARAVDGVVVAVAVGAEAKVPAKAAAVMGTTEAVTMGWATRTRAAKGVAGTEGP
jgi:hypothetical protein